MVIEVDPQGRINLSRKAALSGQMPTAEELESEHARGGPPRGPRNFGGGGLRRWRRRGFGGPRGGAGLPRSRWRGGYSRGGPGGPGGGPPRGPAAADRAAQVALVARRRRLQSRRWRSPLVIHPSVVHAGAIRPPSRPGSLVRGSGRFLCGWIACPLGHAIHIALRSASNASELLTGGGIPQVPSSAKQLLILAPTTLDRVIGFEPLAPLANG